MLHVQIQKTANVDRSRQRYNEVHHGSPSVCGLLSKTPIHWPRLRCMSKKLINDSVLGVSCLQCTTMSSPTTTNPVPEWIQHPYPALQHSLISFPRKHVLLVTINRPEYRNCLPVEATIELGFLWRWYDAEPELRCAVFTGAGDQAFCSGMDLKQRLDIKNTNSVAHEYPVGGFGGMANRTGKKPIIVACNGHAHGKKTCFGLL